MRPNTPLVLVLFICLVCIAKAQVDDRIPSTDGNQPGMNNRELYGRSACTVVRYKFEIEITLKKGVNVQCPADAHEVVAEKISALLEEANYGLLRDFGVVKTGNSICLQQKKNGRGLRPTPRFVYRGTGFCTLCPRDNYDHRLLESLVFDGHNETLSVSTNNTDVSDQPFLDKVLTLDELVGGNFDAVMPDEQTSLGSLGLVETAPVSAAFAERLLLDTQLERNLQPRRSRKLGRPTKKPSNSWKKPTNTWKKPTSTWKKPTNTWKKPTNTWKKPTNSWKKPTKVSTSSSKKPSDKKLKITTKPPTRKPSGGPGQVQKDVNRGKCASRGQKVFIEKETDAFHVLYCNTLSGQPGYRYFEYKWSVFHRDPWQQAMHFVTYQHFQKFFKEDLTCLHNKVAKANVKFWMRWSSKQTLHETHLGSSSHTLTQC